MNSLRDEPEKHMATVEVLEVNVTIRESLPDIVTFKVRNQDEYLRDDGVIEFTAQLPSGEGVAWAQHHVDGKYRLTVMDQKAVSEWGELK